MLMPGNPHRLTHEQMAEAIRKGGSVLIQRPAVRQPDGGLAYPAPLHVNRVQDLPAEVELAGHGYGDIKAVRARLDREAGAKQAEADLAAETAAKVEAEMKDRAARDAAAQAAEKGARK
jgi:hypothetical protein